MSDLPLQGTRILEVGGIGPSPFAGMLLAELGADVVRIDRPAAERVLPGAMDEDLLNRGKRSIVLDLKRRGDVDTLLELVERADVLTEGFRPGVAERLGFGPEVCLERKPSLVYGRMTGWGQSGPLAARAGHDINYIGLTGALHAIGAADGRPMPPLNLLGDFGGGALYLVVGILAALHDGGGRVVDCAIVDGTAHLLAAIHGLVNAGAWTDEREGNLLDGGAPYYRTYETRDGRYLAVGAIEPKFYLALLTTLGVELDPARQDDRATWPATAALLARAFLARDRDDWAAVFADVDACVTPVLGLAEAAEHPQVAVSRDGRGSLRPGAAPRFSGSAPTPDAPAPALGQDTDDVLEEWLGRELPLRA